MRWWDWGDPGFVLAFVAAIGGAAGAFAAILIPALLYVFGRRSQAVAQQALDDQRDNIARQRRDHLLASLPIVTDQRYFELLSAEINNYEEPDREMLLRAKRRNPLTPLPWSSRQVDEVSTRDFIESLPARYSRKRASEPFPELIEFLRRIGVAAGQEQVLPLMDLIVGSAADVQRPGHTFYRELVSTGGWYLAVPLLHAVERVPPTGLRLNILTGVLLGLKDIELKRPTSGVLVAPDEHEIEDFLAGSQSALASLLHRGVLSNFSVWDLEGRTEPVSATVAWLVRAVGVQSGRDQHADMRCVENLCDCVASIPAGEGRGWGTDLADVRFGLDQLKVTSPALWARHGADLLGCFGV